MCTILRCDPGISWESLLLAIQDHPLLKLDEVVLGFPQAEYSAPDDESCEPGLFSPTVGDITNLPGRKRSKTHRLISTCIEKLKTLQGHVYNLKDDEFLQHLILQIDILKDAVYLQVPKEAGLTVLDSN